MENQVTPEMQAQIAHLDRHLVHTDTIKRINGDFKTLQDGQHEIMEEFKAHEQENARQFEKGAKRMDGIEGSGGR